MELAPASVSSSPFVVVIAFAVFVYCVAFGAFSAFVARSKGRRTVDWFVLGFFFGIFALLAVGFSESAIGRVSLAEEPRFAVDPDEPMKTCSACGTEVPEVATHCGHCGMDFPTRRRAVRTRWGPGAAIPL